MNRSFEREKERERESVRVRASCVCVYIYIYIYGVLCHCDDNCPDDRRVIKDERFVGGRPGSRKACDRKRKRKEEKKKEKVCSAGDGP